MPVCSFKSCLTGSKSKNVVKISNNPVLHRFPKDPYMRSIWQEQAQCRFEKSLINFESAVICSLHFAPYHYLKNSTDKRKLKHDAIPLSSNNIDYYDVPLLRSTTPTNSPVNNKMEVITTPSGKFYVQNIYDPNYLPEDSDLSKNLSRKILFDGNISLSISEDLGVQPLISVKHPRDEQIYNYDENISYLTTRKLDQDLVENTFSYLKGMCGSASNNITVLDFKYSLRWYILGKHSDCIFTNNTNTECGIETSLLNDDECLTSHIIHNSEIITESYDVIELGEETTFVNKESLDLLEQFEMNVDSGNSFNQIEFQAAKYIAGYVANRYFSKYPQLIDQNGDESSWIEHVSRGGIKIPSVTLMETVEIMEKEFQKLHGDDLSKITGVMKYLTDTLWSKVSSQNIPKEVLQCLVRTRTFIRLNNLNSKLLYNKKPCKNKKLIKFFK